MYKKLRSIGLLIGLLAFSNFSEAQYAFDQLPFHSGNGYPRAQSMVVIDTFLYFTAADDTHGRELWISDGTMSGSRMVKDIFPGKDYSMTGNGSHFITAYNNKVYFTANDGTSGLELWVTDGTTNGTQLLKDIYPGALFSNPQHLTVYNGKLYFSANDGTNGTELWVTDGTTNGTQMLKDLEPGSNGSAPSQFTVYNGKMYFSAKGGIWETDGTVNGTQLATITTTGSIFSGINIVGVFNNKLYFAANHNPVVPPNGMHGLWETDGTVNGTKYIKDISIYNLQKATIFNNKMYFAARENTNIPIGYELFASDGTTAGTQMVKDINTAGASPSSYPDQFTVVGNQLYFEANDGVHGDEIWMTDGTTNGTKLVADIMFDPHNPTRGSRPKNLTSFDNKLFFSAQDTTFKNDFWISDGTVAGTKKLIAYDRTLFFRVDHDDVPFFICNNNLYFIGYHSPKGGDMLWKMTDTSTTTNISTTKKEYQITIAPNPAHDKVLLTFGESYEQAQVSITDLTGKVLLTQQIDATKKQVELTLPSVSTGIYLLNLQHKKGVITQRLLIE
ncbi:MAG: T9SS type A sorting domain-containing protein [Flavipsychrobacter sp.]